MSNTDTVNAIAKNHTTRMELESLDASAGSSGFSPRRLAGAA